MDFSHVIGQKHIKSHLETTLKNGRIPHAQLFVGNNGSGLLTTVIAYAKGILCSELEAGSAQYNNTCSKVAKLSHPDLHFVYPVNTSETISKNPISDSYAEEWRKFVLENPYGSLYDWLQELGIENKQGNISVKEAEDISRKLSLKAYEGGYKIMIIWMAENMNVACSNKILKLIEEPPDKTVLLLLTENEDQILTTISSRCQKLTFPLLSEEDISKSLMENCAASENLAKNISRQAKGDYNKALYLLSNNGETDIYEQWFVMWVRSAFKAKGNKGAINDLLTWSDKMASEGRETQKRFLEYCIETFRQALLINYKAEDLVYFEKSATGFDISKFAPFIHQNNIYEIIESVSNAAYHIERNGNAKITFTDLSIKLTRLIHSKE